MDVLLSIRPEFALRIFDGTKRFEYRRIIFRERVDKIIVYASSPVKKVVGEFSVQGIIFADLGDLWHRTKRHSGISEEYFYSYFYDKDNGYAIKVGNITKYR